MTAALTPDSERLLKGLKKKNRTKKARATFAGVQGDPGQNRKTSTEGTRAGQMNKTEAAYAHVLDRDPTVIAWAFEVIAIRLPGHKISYRPDFLVWRRREHGDFLAPDPRGHEDASWVEIHEVKGHLRDDARDKLKVASTLNPWFRFYLVTHIDKTWKASYIEPGPNPYMKQKGGGYANG